MIFFIKFFVSWSYKEYIIFILASTVQFYIGFDFYKSSINALKNKIADMNLLVVVGTSAAYFYSLFVLFFPQFFPETSRNTYFESAAAIITFILLGRYLETKARNKATSFMKSLLNLKPQKSIIIVDGKEIEVDADSIVEGDIVVLKKGDKVPVDGIVIEGSCEVNQSAITGEYMPVLKEKGQNVISGSLVQDGYCKIKALRNAKSSVLNQIIKTILEAQSKKPPIAKFADKVVYYFVPTIIIISILTFDIWYFFTENFQLSLIPSVSVLIIACPCALGLATPIAVVSLIGRSAKEGILIKNSDVVEIINNVKTVVFDKTGTLTKGKLKVSSFILENEGLKDYLYTLASKSNHPISKAMVEKFEGSVLEVENFENITGKGLRAVINREIVLNGSLRLMKENNVEIPKKYIEFYENETKKGKVVVFLAVNSKVVGVVSIEDEIREEANEVISKLKKEGYEILMITGDSKNTALEVAKKLGIDNVYFEVFPEDKLKIVENLQEEGKKVMFVGDGINDAPAMAKADVGLSMSSGADIAKETGDAVILSNNLKSILKFIKLSKEGNKIIKQNLFWAYFYNSIGIPVAAGILYPINGVLLKPVFASIAMSFSSVSVVLNALRLQVKRL
ncbi:copper-translocating P-type ATPase [Hydrogenivirga sp. 128-5-R1-1]|uniref:copper-translocating P-type ATPase n=1 Tax=Hydrogenivirga sp. 128-5-R1-1 TaxID=392423 RepID=UPI0031B60A26